MLGAKGPLQYAPFLGSTPQNTHLDGWRQNLLLAYKRETPSKSLSGTIARVVSLPFYTLLEQTVSPSRAYFTVLGMCQRFGHVSPSPTVSQITILSQGPFTLAYFWAVPGRLDGLDGSRLTWAVSYDVKLNVLANLLGRAGKIGPFFACLIQPANAHQNLE